MQPKRASRLLTAAILFSCSNAYAGVYRIGAAVGFGGAGIQKRADISDDPDTPDVETVNRAESPGAFTLFAETLFNPSMAIGIEHSRGFTLGPLASHVSFTGLTYKYYYFKPPLPVMKSVTETTVSVRKFGAYVGGGAGLAKGSISTSSDRVPTVNGSGVYVGYKVGAEYVFESGFGIRPEVSYNMTLFAGGTYPASLSEFAIQVGIFIFL